MKISGQFKLGALVTESSHPITANLSEVAKEDIAKALDLLFQVDNDVIAKYREFVKSGRAEQIKKTVLGALQSGGKIFFTGCGSTGRLSILLVSIWRNFWQKVTQKEPEPVVRHLWEGFEHRAFSVMAGGDFALIKSVEGFEDFAAFGKKQIGDLGVSSKDVVFAITEGGETSFVIGTARKGVEVGAKVYFVYNNPDDILCQHVERSREVIEDARIEKINPHYRPDGDHRFHAHAGDHDSALRFADSARDGGEGFGEWGNSPTCLHESSRRPSKFGFSGCAVAVSLKTGGDARSPEVAGSAFSTGEIGGTGRISLSRWV